MRRPLIAGNWKMNKTIPEALGFASGLIPLVPEFGAVEVVLCPPFTALAALAAALEKHPVALGAQDVAWAPMGAYTGEVSPALLRDAGCRYAIIGHSERRQYCAETDEMVNRKIASALSGGLIPILCVGETLAEREAGDTKAVIGRQLRLALADLKTAGGEDLVVAYEPLWAIGTGRAATAAMAGEVCREIRAIFGDLLGQAAAEAVRVLYGGSVRGDNIGQFMAEAAIDGALVGGASLDVAGFGAIIRAARQEGA